jgi:hypothetical protein
MCKKATKEKYQMIPMYLFLNREEQEVKKEYREMIVYNPKKRKEMITYLQIQSIPYQSVLIELELIFLEYICQGFTVQEAFGEMLRKIIMSKGKISFYDVGINIDKMILFQKAGEYMEKHPTQHDLLYTSKMYILKKEYPVQWKQLLEVVNQIVKHGIKRKIELESRGKERQEIEKKMKEYGKRFQFDPVCFFLNPQTTYKQLMKLKEVSSTFLKGMPFLKKEFGK